jgi:acyl-coenzyme A synthetase/AMP-(fatty) acid ligase
VSTDIQRLQLVTHTAADSIVAWSNYNSAPDSVANPVTLRQFLADVEQLTAALPPNCHLLNMCSDRYRFSVGVAAAIVTGKISLLPSTHTPEMIQQLKTFAPDVFCLTDNDTYTLDLPQLQYPVMMPNKQTDALTIPQISSNQLVAMVFTSGSTGTPLPHPKTWGALVSSVQAEALRLGLMFPNNIAPCTLIGTVPPQHMYGFESTVLMAWQSGNAISYAHPFYPADICQALAAVPAPRVLVSSPVHLRALLDAELTIPEIACVVSATAPLSTQLALDIEVRCHSPLMEIYGSTETGLIATRRSTQTTEWQLLPGIKLVTEGDGVQASGGHIAIPTPMHDIIELITDEHFLLHGRLADLVNIAGKRHSLASLNHLLNTIPGVVDGAFYMPDESDHTHVTRLAACVVAPGLSQTQLLTALRERIDPIFLPRPLLFIDALPRNSTGKLPRVALEALFNQAHNLNQPRKFNQPHSTRKSA